MHTCKSAEVGSERYAVDVSAPPLDARVFRESGLLWAPWGPNRRASAAFEQSVTFEIRVRRQITTSRSCTTGGPIKPPRKVPYQ
jgi:hypothetical protein